MKSVNSSIGTLLMLLVEFVNIYELWTLGFEPNFCRCSVIIQFYVCHKIFVMKPVNFFIESLIM